MTKIFKNSKFLFFIYINFLSTVFEYVKIYEKAQQAKSFMTYRIKQHFVIYKTIIISQSYYSFGNIYSIKGLVITLVLIYI